MSTTEEHNWEAALANLNAEQLKHDLAVVTAFGLSPYPDGNYWCVSLGDDLQVGIAGFGDTPYKAIMAFNDAFFNSKTPAKMVSEVKDEHALKALGGW